jgi:hypothetical protein
MALPKPVVAKQVCSVCGLDWERHAEKPGYEDCIKLLKADLAKRPSVIYGHTTAAPFNINWPSV